MTLDIAELDAAPASRVAEELRACCGAPAWVAGMLARRPFRTRAALLHTSDDVCSELRAADWLEAFAHHPRIGERHAAASVAPAAHAWSTAEQSSARSTATDGARAALADGNRAYEARFGFIFIICATGLGADEILAALHRRMNNAPDAELRIAAEEQRKITRLRLEKLVPASSDTERLG